MRKIEKYEIFISELYCSDLIKLAEPIGAISGKAHRPGLHRWRGCGKGLRSSRLSQPAFLEVRLDYALNFITVML